MPLRLAGEEQTQVMGLDSQGWVREVQAPDGGYSLRLPDATTGAKGLKIGGTKLYESGGLQVEATGNVSALAAVTSGGHNGWISFSSGVGTNNRVVIGAYSGHAAIGGHISSLGGWADLRLLAGAAGYLHLTSGGDIILNPVAKVDIQKRLYNSGAGDGGAVAVADAVRVQGPVDAWDNLDSGAWQVALNPTDRAVWFKFKTADQDPPTDGEGVLYLAEVGGVRKLVAKLKSGGVVYTGTLNLT